MIRLIVDNKSQRNIPFYNLVKGKPQSAAILADILILMWSGWDEGKCKDWKPNWYPRGAQLVEETGSETRQTSKLKTMVL